MRLSTLHTSRALLSTNVSLYSLSKLDDFIRNWTCDLPACSIVLPLHYIIKFYLKKYIYTIIIGIIIIISIMLIYQAVISQLLKFTACIFSEALSFKSLKVYKAYKCINKWAICENCRCRLYLSNILAEFSVALPLVCQNDDEGRGRGSSHNALWAMSEIPHTMQNVQHNKSACIFLYPSFLQAVQIL
jgi:hypothetical protein